IRTTGNDFPLFESADRNAMIPSSRRPVEKKNMVILYDGGDHSDVVLRTTSWLEHSGNFKVHVVSMKKKEHNHEEEYGNDAAGQIESVKREQFLSQIGVEFNELYLSKETENNSEMLSKLCFSALSASQPDLVILGASIGKFSLFSNSHLQSLLEQLDCPVIVARSFTIPGMHYLKSWLMKIIRK
ncbi:MAG TPA: universal stress protein, partial [Nitrososphaeraceae archaeon]